MTLRIFALLLCLAITAEAKPAPKPTPAPFAWQLTAAELAQLKGDIQGIKDAATDAITKADAAEADAQTSRAHSAIAAQNLADAGVKLDAIQTAYDQMQADRDKAIARADAEKALAERFAWIIGLELALIVLLACLKFGLPALFPPWGIVATCALPLVAMTVIKLLPHIQ